MQLTIAHHIRWFAAGKFCLVRMRTLNRVTARVWCEVLDYRTPYPGHLFVFWVSDTLVSGWGVPPVGHPHFLA